MKEAIPAIPETLKDLMPDPGLGMWAADVNNRILTAYRLGLAQTKPENVPSDLAPLWEELEAVARTGGATVAAETCMGLIREVVRLREALRMAGKYTRHSIMCPHNSENMRSNSDCNCGYYDFEVSARAALAAEPGEERK